MSTREHPALLRYEELLATEGITRGLIGPREVPRLWSRHIGNCALLAPLLPEGASVADIGAGAGLPGLVLAVVRPDLSVTLIEPLLRRTTFLDETVAELGLANVEVVRARAEELHGKRSFDVVTSRAVAAFDKLLRWSMPLVAPGGALIALKGSSVRQEIEEAGPTLSALGCDAPEVVDLTGTDGVESTTAVRVVRRAAAR